LRLALQRGGAAIQEGLTTESTKITEEKNRQGQGAEKGTFSVNFVFCGESFLCDLRRKLRLVRQRRTAAIQERLTTESTKITEEKNRQRQGAEKGTFSVNFVFSVVNLLIATCEENCD
jgi:hypothetical protein